MRKVLLASTIALLGLTSTAQAHFILQAPPQTNPGDATQGKGSPPCGPDTMMAATPTPAQGGHPLMIKVLETVGHLGFYRVALAINSRSEIPVDNVVYDKNNKVLPPSGVPSGTSDHADIEMPAKFPVLADGLFSHETSSPNQMPYMGEVMLPNVNCDRCTLQVIEFMHPHGFNTSVPGPGGGYFYHHCAELKITADPNMPLYDGGGADGGTTDAGKDAANNGTAGAGGTTGAAGTGTTGTGGTGGSGGATSGAAGANGAAGSTSGAAGTGITGASGSTGNGGSSPTGTSVPPSGAAGTTAGSGGQHSSSGGGCSLAGNGQAGVSVAGLILLVALVARRRRSR
jgi:hypothetical protein